MIPIISPVTVLTIVKSLQDGAPQLVKLVYNDNDNNHNNHNNNDNNNV